MFKLLSENPNYKELQKQALKNRTWNNYASGLYNKGTKTVNHTKLFFEGIDPDLRDYFLNSEQPILQFGMSSGKYLVENQCPTHRDCIGYDYADKAKELAEENGLTMRKVDLDSIQNNELLYAQMLQEDLLKPSHIVAIRILEYLDEEAAILLISTLIELAKPGSIFYIETYNHEPNPKVPEIATNYPHGYFASFFGVRTDIVFKNHSVNQNSESEEESSECLIVEKQGIINSRN